ncbi:MAG: hypothetical protein B7Z55_07335 [Planctomycetales bacterium 12-60-4]|nr:MAG: hypothetical protein B7Z55_07335 [Planctomycetales bacterium 12-60-4]
MQFNLRQGDHGPQPLGYDAFQTYLAQDSCLAIREFDPHKIPRTVHGRRCPGQRNIASPSHRIDFGCIRRLKLQLADFTAENLQLKVGLEPQMVFANSCRRLTTIG